MCCSKHLLQMWTDTIMVGMAAVRLVLVLVGHPTSEAWYDDALFLVMLCPSPLLNCYIVAL